MLFIKSLYAALCYSDQLTKFQQVTSALLFHVASQCGWFDVISHENNEWHNRE